MSVPIPQSLFRLNFLPLWSREVPVWGNRVTATSLDRLVNLWLHRCGLRGAEEKQFLQQQICSGMRVVDIGANQGMYTMLLSRLVGPDGRLYSFEPDPSLFAALERDCRKNNLRNVELHNVALGRRPGELTFYRSRVNSGDNRLARSNHPEWFDEFTVRVDALDSLLQGRVDFFKIDVQGWEYQVFLGMEQLLSRNPHARIYFEYWPFGLESAGCPPLDCLSYLSSRGYTLYQPSATTLIRLTDPEALTRSLAGQKYTDLLAVNESFSNIENHSPGVTS